MRLLPLRLASLALACLSLGWPAGSIGAAVEAGPRRAAAAPASEGARVIVRYREGATWLPRRSVVLRAGARPPRGATVLGERLGLRLQDGRALDGHTQVLRATSGLDSQALADRLAAQPDVLWAVPDRRRQALAAPNDPLYPGGQTLTTPVVGQWYLRAPTATVKSSLDIEPAWAITQGSASLVVAVLDTGARLDHPDLSGRTENGYDFVGWGDDVDATTALAIANDGSLDDANPSDPGDWITAAEDGLRGGVFEGCGESTSSWHGTQTLGLVGAATGNGIGMAGVAPGVRLLPVRVLGKCGGYDSDIIAAMRWAGGLAVEGVGLNPQPARVLNMSLGSGGSCSAAYQEAVDDLAAVGAVVVAAAGNDGLAVGTPANCSGVIAVTGVRHTGTKVGYSSLGAEATVAAPAGNCVNESGACLYPILSTTNTGTQSPQAHSYTTSGDDYAVGTSFSSPLVAGTVALMLSANPDLSTSQIISVLRNTARDFPASGADSDVKACHVPLGDDDYQDSECYCTVNTCGAGLLDAGAALAAVQSGAVSRPVAVMSASAVDLTAGQSASVSASRSSAVGGATLSTPAWSLISGTGVARLVVSSGGWTATVTGLAAGQAVVQLQVTDSSGQQSTTRQTFTITAASTGGETGGQDEEEEGGGAWQPLWLAGLVAAGLALPGRRRRPGQPG
ncbi:S8 family peptidase [Ideonella livida]|uniref:S8 family serine peptidase n=1 Tax=Ideonella livida TaxID=2707176 RepID=A0A7C9PJV7_9BURK|nr:S8 family peptidase [Ideonella livida]NDY93857.1 S8 family serine peptidase [Ideonella livida]